jgi:hypothetical protein
MTLLLKLVDRNFKITIKHVKEGLQRLGAVVNACNLSTWEAEVGGLTVQGQPRLHRDTLSLFSSSQKAYRERKIQW